MISAMQAVKLITQTAEVHPQRVLNFMDATASAPA
jgi:hypothetical protein